MNPLILFIALFFIGALPFAWLHEKKQEVPPITDNTICKKFIDDGYRTQRTFKVEVV